MGNKNSIANNFTLWRCFALNGWFHFDILVSIRAMSTGMSTALSSFEMKPTAKYIQSLLNGVIHSFDQILSLPADSLNRGNLINFSIIKPLCKGALNLLIQTTSTPAIFSGINYLHSRKIHTPTLRLACCNRTDHCTPTSWASLFGHTISPHESNWARIDPNDQIP